MTTDHKKVLQGYPDQMSLEQMRVACHISKRTARRLLLTGLVPCKMTGKKTHSYQIRKTDVAKYLRNRKASPGKYAMGNGNYDLAYSKAVSNADSAAPATNAVSASSAKEYPDVLTSKQAAQMAGVATSAINGWAKNNLIISFRKSGVLRIPKSSLVEYLQSSRHRFNCTWKREQFAK